MSDFLTSLAARALQPSLEVQPQLLSLFEPGHLDDETVQANDDGLPIRSDAMREDEIADEKAPARNPAPHAVAARLDQLEAILRPRANAPSASAPLPPVGPRDDGFPREVFADRDSLAVPAGEAGETPFAKLPPAPVRREDETQPDFVVPVTRETAARGTPIQDARPRVTIASRTPPPPIIPAQASPLAAPLRLPRESKPRHSDPARDAEPRVIQISIGRLEIRASTSTPPSRPRASEQAPQAMTLDEYLRHKSAGGGQ